MNSACNFANVFQLSCKTGGTFHKLRFFRKMKHSVALSLWWNTFLKVKQSSATEWNNKYKFRVSIDIWISLLSRKEKEDSTTFYVYFEFPKIEKNVLSYAHFTLYCNISLRNINFRSNIDLKILILTLSIILKYWSINVKLILVQIKLILICVRYLV